MTPAAAVIWDLGGVLIRWRPEAAVAHLFDDLDAARAALAAVDFAAWNDALDGGADWDAAVANGAAAHPGRAALFAAYRDGLAEAHRETIPGSVALVETLAAAGVAQFALSNAAVRSGETVREIHPFMAHFRDVGISAAEGVRKPDPALFRILLDRNGLAAGTCVFIDDSAKNAEAARAVGLRAIDFTDPAQCAEALRAEGLPV